MRSRRRDGAGGPAPWLHLFGVIGWTWSFLGLAAVSGRALLGFPAVVLYVLGGMGPVVVPVALLAAARWDATLDERAGLPEARL